MYLKGDQWYDAFQNAPDRFGRKCRKLRCWCAAAVLVCLVGIALVALV